MKPYTGPAALARGPMEVDVVERPLESALSWLGGERPAMAAMLRRLVEVNSFTRNLAGVNAVIGHRTDPAAAWASPMPPPAARCGSISGD